MCVSAALDAVKQSVDLPWVTKPSPPPEEIPEASAEPKVPPTRVLNLGNFEKALKEITPSSSETLGSLADLRKWNDEFGEGRKGQRRLQVWGKDKFGFNEGLAAQQSK